MSHELSDTDLIFGDLTHAAVELMEQRSSPLSVRRGLREFITLSQQLTCIMYKEYTLLSGGSKWKAKAFVGWNAVSDFFRELRNTDFHECPVLIRVQETQYFAVGDIFDDNQGASELVVQGTWELGNPFATYIPDDLNIAFQDPVTGGPSNKKIEPRRRKYVFKLVARTPEIEKLMKKVDTDDVHELVAQCLAVLTDYFDFYKKQLPIRGT